MIRDSSLRSERHNERTYNIHGFRFFVGLRLRPGELVGISVGLGCAVGLVIGNANVGDTDAAGVALGDGEGLGVGLGVGEGGMIFSQ